MKTYFLIYKAKVKNNGYKYREMGTIILTSKKDADFINAHLDINYKLISQQEKEGLFNNHVPY